MINDRRISFPTLATERLKLRQLVESDAEEIFSLRSNPLVNKYLDRRPSVSLDDAFIFIQNINESIKNGTSHYWAIEWLRSGKTVGTICLFDVLEEERKGEIGYELLPSFQKKGIAQEALTAVVAYAFDTLALRTIVAYTHKDNLSSTKLLQKLSFVSQENRDDPESDLILFRLDKS